jgi:hypothetical protein
MPAAPLFLQATLVDQQDHEDQTGARASYPFGAWSYHSSMQLIKNTPKKPLRIFTHNSEFDLGWNTSTTPIDFIGNISTNNTAVSIFSAFF